MLILHSYLKHELRLLQKLARDRNIDYDSLADLELDEGFEKQLLNMQNGNIIDTYEIDGNVIDVEAATKQDVEMIKELVSGICVTQCNNSQVINIVNEEAESYYSGQKQAEEVADIVEKRMSIYVNE